jgi:hypothetical protein
MAGKSVLLVEGNDDEHVVKHICGTRSLGQIDKIRDCGGKSPLLDLIPLQVKESDVFAVGILLDADTDLLASWQAVTVRLTSAGYSGIPAAPDPNGTVIAAHGAKMLPRVGIWLMPNNCVAGILEDFLRFLVPLNDPLFGHVVQSIDTILPGHCRFTDLKKPKARIHTWLAWQAEPGKPFGQAITARYLDHDLPAADVFAQWLHRTFFAP